MKRYDFDMTELDNEYEEGEFVRYKDAMKEIVQLRKELVFANDTIKSNCVTVDSLLKVIDGRENEISQLKQALQKLTPLQLVWDDSDLEGGYVETCIFCPDWLEYGHHSEDCEYIQLTK